MAFFGYFQQKRGEKSIFWKNRSNVVDERAMPIGKMVSLFILPLGNPEKCQDPPSCGRDDQTLWLLEYLVSLFFFDERNNIIVNARLHFYFWLMNVPTFFYRNQNKTKQFSSIEKFSHLNAHLFLFPYKTKSAGALNRLLRIYVGIYLDLVYGDWWEMITPLNHFEMELYFFLCGIWIVSKIAVFSSLFFSLIFAIPRLAIP